MTRSRMYLTDLGRLLNQTPRTVSGYRGRYAGTPDPFPPPDGIEGKRSWWAWERREELRAWDARRVGQGAGGGRRVEVAEHVCPHCSTPRADYAPGVEHLEACGKCRSTQAPIPAVVNGQAVTINGRVHARDMIFITSTGAFTMACSCGWVCPVAVHAYAPSYPEWDTHLAEQRSNP